MWFKKKENKKQPVELKNEEVENQFQVMEKQVAVFSAMKLKIVELQKELEKYKQENKHLIDELGRKEHLLKSLIDTVEQINKIK